MSRKFQTFDSRLVPLIGSNLIEASAGTGKTYSVAILFLRLILEKQLSVKEILMVTFTKAAVAELEERIRLFVRQAYKASRGEKIKDQMIAGLVKDAIATSGEKQVREHLNTAVLFLDETSVLTIHSFCQQALNEFAFETGQLFGANLLQDTNGALEDEINKFWRKNITTVPAELLGQLLPLGLSRKAIIAIVKEHLSGKRYLEHKNDVNYSFCADYYSHSLNFLKELRGQEEKVQQSLLNEIVDNRQHLENLCNSNVNAKKNILVHLDTPEEFLKQIVERRASAYIKLLFQEILDQYDSIQIELQEIEVQIKKTIYPFYCLAINEVAEGIRHFKQRNNQMSFDDLIVKMHEALVKKDNPSLVEALQTKYKAVFIDEFQDTDRLQYEVFEKAFGTNTILFYIGDPKQSIYAWRKADIFTYFQAREAVDSLYGMNHNYRSSESLIKAMNLFFKPDEDFDTFHFENAEDAIEYIEVNSPSPNTKGNLVYGNEIDIPISITRLPNKESICNALGAQVIQLLSCKTYVIDESGEKREVRPSDIGILVRGNQEGRAVKAILARYGIPALTIGDAKVLKSAEAKYLLYILEAISDISRSKVNKALLSSFTGYSDDQILSIDEETAIEQFRKYKVSWDKGGVYKALSDFITDFKVKNVLLEHNTESGERILTNLYQLVELLHKEQTHKKLTLPELVSWLKRGIDGMETEGDEFEQRVESDEEAVKIVTIHSSKGLEYNIVLAPFLDLLLKTPHETCSFRDPESGEYVAAEKTQLNLNQKAEYNKQLEQENRRLIYVAITRAVYKCFIYKNTGNSGEYKYSISSLAAFTDLISSEHPDLIEFKEALQTPERTTFIKVSEEPEVKHMEVQFNLMQQNWRRMSYTALSPDHEVSLKNRSAVHDDKYEHFVFTQLRKGAKTGNMLHHIFENIHFTDPVKWRYVIDHAINRFAAGNKELYSSMLMELAGHVLNTSISTGTDQIFLSNISPDKRINELEFDFTIPVFKTSDLRALSDDRIEVSVKDLQEIEGMMNGKVDLFFEYNGKYYILDWKSNYLGDSLSDYSADKLALAMNENNYHLQYLIYTLAVKKYLESRLPDFDYESQFGGVIYLFLRGIRKCSDTGIFTHKPSIEKMDALKRILSIEKMGGVV